MPPYPIYELDRLKREEIKAKISKRALMLEKIVGNDVPNLPCLPSELCSIIAKYEGEVQSSVLGDASASATWWCDIL